MGGDWGAIYGCSGGEWVMNLLRGDSHNWVYGSLKLKFVSPISCPLANSSIGSNLGTGKISANRTRNFATGFFAVRTEHICSETKEPQHGEQSRDNKRS